jgi:hydrogenase-1 operon protein HyaF
MNTSIPDRSAGCVDPRMGQAVLREVGQLLAQLAVQPDFCAAVDLRSLPMDDAERDALRQRLGFGEVKAAFDAGGPTQITETAYAGVWWIRHGDEDAGGPLFEQIVVARVPELLLADPAAIVDSSARLDGDLGIEVAPAQRDAGNTEVRHD